jgi:hypothetical protein
MPSRSFAIGTLLASAASGVAAFAPSAKPTARASMTLNVVTDPTVVTKKEYEDICGVSFDEETLMKRLESTNFLYPKHVEVIKDIAPIAGAMVDEVVSMFWRSKRLSGRSGQLENVDVLGDTHDVAFCLREDNADTRPSLDQTMYLTTSFMSLYNTAFGNGRKGLATARLPSRHDHGRLDGKHQGIP